MAEGMAEGRVVMENKIENLISKLRGNYFIIFILATGFLVTGIVAFVLQAIVFALVRPWSLKTYRKLSYYFSALMYSHQLLLVHWWSNTQVQIIVDPDDLKNHFGKEHSILLLNHKYEIDILIITAVCNYFGMEGNLRGFAKKSLQYLPIFGWLWKLQEHVFLERNFEKDKKILEERLQSLLGHDDPVTLVLFPEGTRLTKEKYIASMAFAREKGLPELKHHLLPRTRGFETCVQTVKNDNFESSLPLAVYDGIVVMEPGDCCRKVNQFSFAELTRGQGPRVKILLKRYPVQGISAEEAGKWLHKKFLEKDEYMDNFCKTGQFDEEFTNDGFLKLPKPLNVLVLIGVLNFICFLYVLWYIRSIVMYGNVYVIGIVFLMVFGASKAFRMIGDITKIEKGSVYGQNRVT